MSRVIVMAKMRRMLKFCWKYRNQLVIVLTPILLLPLPMLAPGEMKMKLCAYTVSLMGVYWLTEAIPLPVTAFVPIFLLPSFGIMTTREVCDSYLKDTNAVIMGGCIVALAIENTRLHRRVAVKVLLTVGAKPRWLMFGFQLTTWLLSMCITNTATVAMMLPILDSVISQMGMGPTCEGKEPNPNVANRDELVQIETVVSDFKKLDNGHIDQPISVVTIDDSTNEPVLQSNTNGSAPSIKAMEAESKQTTSEKEKKELRALFVGITLSIVFAANIGGIGTLTGTGPNLILKKNIDDVWEKHGLGESPVNFSTWFIFGLPIAVVNLFFLWIWMQFVTLGIKTVFGCCFDVGNRVREEKIRRIMLEEQAKLGPIRLAESLVAVLFATLVLLWFFRAPGFMMGWGGRLQPGYIGTATPVMLVVLILFALPMNLPGRQTGARLETILNWPMVQRKFPWGVIFLMGGGFAIADASVKTGLSVWIGNKLEIITELPSFLMIYVLCLAVGLLTEVTSNVAICTMLMPIMGSMAVNMKKSPLYLMLPVGVTSSFAYMLPVSNPPNALGFEYANMKILDMVKAGWALKLFTILPVTIVTQTWAYTFFDLGTLPWNVTSLNTTTPAI